MTTPQNFDQLYPGDHLKAGHFEQPRTLTIEAIGHKPMKDENGIEKIKVILKFREEPLSHVACKTNGICIREILGNHVPSWIGKRVTLHASTWNNEPCIRVYGSPELERDKEVIVSLPRRKPFTMLLRATGQRQAAPALQQASKPAATPKVERSAVAQSYIQSMADAASTADLQNIEEALAEDNRLSADETTWLAKQLVRRTEQLATQG